MTLEEQRYQELKAAFYQELQALTSRVSYRVSFPERERKLTTEMMSMDIFDSCAAMESIAIQLKELSDGWPEDE